MSKTTMTRKQTRSDQAKASTLIPLTLASFLLPLFPFSSAHALPARFGVAPDNSTQLAAETLQGAKKSILLNLYELENAALAEILIERIRAGVTVRVLLEREPLGRISPESREIIFKVFRAMRASGNSGHEFFLMTGKNLDEQQGGRRFRYNHAKYIVVDAAKVWVSSENFSQGGHPVPGNVGNRGWQTTIESKTLARKFTEMFLSDSDPNHEDIVELTLDHQLPVAEPKPAPSNPGPAPDPVRKHPARPIGKGTVQKATLITSPNALPPVLKILDSAQRNLEVQHMNLPSTWRDDDFELFTNPLLEGLVRAARRGVQVRVLLNDENAFNSSPAGQGPERSGERAGAPAGQAAKKRPNETTVALIQTLAHCENLPIQARIIDTKAAGLTYIHNKGMLADGRRALVSSINGTRNSFENNREVAVLLDSPDAAKYYGEAFDFDWRLSPEPSPNQISPCPQQFELWRGGFAWLVGTPLNSP